MAMLPFVLPLTYDDFTKFEFGGGSPRRLSDMAASYGDQAAVKVTLATDDPIIYDFYAIKDLPGLQQLWFGLTKIAPGTVGDEYYMTKGHFHAREADGDEIYIVISGRGHLVLQSRAGEAQVIEMTPGGLYYTPASWAHRTVNSGAEELVFLSVWTSQVAYDYETITRQNGFPRRVVNVDGTPAVIDNAQFQPVE